MTVPAFSDACRRALHETRQEAFLLGQGFVGPEHIFLGLLCLREGIAASVIDGLGSDRSELRRRAVSGLPASGATEPAAELPYSHSGMLSLKAAMRLARDDGAPVHTGHVFLAVLEEGGLSERLELDVERVRTLIATSNTEEE